MNANPTPQGQGTNGQGSEHQPFADPNSMDLGSMPADLSAAPMTAHFDRSPATGSAAIQRAEEEARGVSDVERNNLLVDRFAQGQIDRSFTLTQQWITDRSMYRAVQKVRTEMLNASSEYRMAFYKHLMDARLEALRERTTSALSMLKGLYREQVASFLMSQMDKLATEADHRQRSFIERMKGKHAYADSLKAFPTTREQYMKTILAEEGRSLKFIDSLVERFEGIVDEEFKKYA
jgi:hypothetical protein